MAQTYPELGGVAIDSTNARELAEFYRQLLGLIYRPGDEPPPEGQPDERGQDWLVLTEENGRARLAFQQVAEMAPSTWPHPAIPQQMHLDLTVPDVEELKMQHQRALALGATMLEDRFDNPQEPLYVYADPAGHPFCIFVGKTTVTKPS